MYAVASIYALSEGLAMVTMYNSRLVFSLRPPVAPYCELCVYVAQWTRLQIHTESGTADIADQRALAAPGTYVLPPMNGSVWCWQQCSLLRNLLKVGVSTPPSVPLYSKYAHVVVVQVA